MVVIVPTITIPGAIAGEFAMAPIFSVPIPPELVAMVIVPEPGLPTFTVPPLEIVSVPVVEAPRRRDAPVLISLDPLPSTTMVPAPPLPMVVLEVVRLPPFSIVRALVPE